MEQSITLPEEKFCALLRSFENNKDNLSQHEIENIRSVIFGLFEIDDSESFFRLAEEARLKCIKYWIRKPQRMCRCPDLHTALYGVNVNTPEMRQFINEDIMKLIKGKMDIFLRNFSDQEKSDSEASPDADMDIEDKPINQRRDGKSGRGIHYMGEVPPLSSWIVGKKLSITKKEELRKDEFIKRQKLEQQNKSDDVKNG